MPPKERPLRINAEKALFAPQDGSYYTLDVSPAVETIQP